MDRNPANNANNQILLSGHRGGKLDYENSLGGFQQAINNQIEEIEFDIWLTIDKVPIIIHGVEGTVGLEGDFGDCYTNSAIVDLTLQQIKKFSLPNGEKIPTFEELLDLCLGMIKLNCEIKDPNLEVCQIVVDMLINKGYDTTNAHFSSFNHSTLDTLKEINPNFKCGYLYRSQDPMPEVEYYSKKGDSCNIPITHLTEELALNCKIANKKVCIYFPGGYLEKLEDYEKCVKYGVYNVISDKPIEFRDFLASIQTQHTIQL
jgi:glycerophosphoryl diester phosphodiesterase